ncbi:MAG: glutathione S-transferase [Chitinivorax sp.]|jgi:glutathione S-transferase
MKLIASLTSPFARKIRVLLLEKDIPCELVVDIPWNADTQVPHYNPLGKVPVLLTDGGRAIYDSPIIAEYLDTIVSTPLFLPEDRRRAIEVKQLEALADGVIDACVTIFLERKRPPERQDMEWIDRQQGKIEHGLQALENSLKGSRYLLGDQLTLGDIATACALGYLDFRFPDIDWRSEHPRLLAYAEQLFARPAFVKTRPPL